MVDTNFVTDSNKTPLIQVITWFLLASAIVCTLCRAYTKWAVVRFIGLDDFLVPASLVYLIVFPKKGKPALAYLIHIDFLDR